MAMKIPVVELVSLHKKFGDHDVLKGIDLLVEAGEVVVVIGPSGSGKTTMLRCINFLETPTSGTVRVLGHELTGKRVRLTRVRREVGMVFQHFNLFPHRTALGNVMEGPRAVLKMPKKEAEARALELLRRVGVAEHAHKKPKR